MAILRQHSVTLFHILAAVLECRVGGLAAEVTMEATLDLTRQLEVEVPVIGAVVAVVAVEAVFKATTTAVVRKVDVVVVVVRPRGGGPTHTHRHFLLAGPPP